jgi:transcriptional regulator with XRE-family HTH domain
MPEEDAEFYEAVGRAIKVHRAERGLGRKRLAELAGVSYPYLSEIENGRKRPSSRALVAIAEGLGLRPHELLETAESLGPSAGSGPPLASWEPAVERHDRAEEPNRRRSWFGERQEAAPAMALRADMLTPTPLVRGEGASAIRAKRARAQDRSRDALISELIGTAEGLGDDDVRRLVDLARRLRR